MRAYSRATEGSARPEGGREAPALGGGSGAARRAAGRNRAFDGRGGRGPACLRAKQMGGGSGAARFAGEPGEGGQA